MTTKDVSQLSTDDLNILRTKIAVETTRRLEQLNNDRSRAWLELNDARDQLDTAQKRVRELEKAIMVFQGVLNKEAATPVQQKY